MNVKNDISEELRSLSTLVATISRETPYRAPEGYFLDFPTVVLKRVQPSLPSLQPDVSRVAGLEPPSGRTSDSEALGGDAKPLTFSVPEGYFEGFAQQVLNRIKAGSGSSADPDVLSPVLAQAGRVNPYAVPEGYFEGLSPILAIVKDKNPYLVPTAYFDTLAAEITGKIAGQPELSGSLVAAGAGSNSRLEIAEEDSAQPKTRVIDLGKRMSWMKYAAAAVVAGLIVTVGWLRWHPVSSSTQTRQLAAVKPTTPAEMAKSLSKVSDAELQNFLVDQDTTLAQPVGNIGSMATVDMDDSNLSSLLGDVSDGELKQYMDEHGGANDIATN